MCQIVISSMCLFLYALSLSWLKFYWLKKNRKYRQKAGKELSKIVKNYFAFHARGGNSGLSWVSITIADSTDDARGTLVGGDRTIVASPSRSGVTWHPGYTPLLHTPPDKRGAIAVRDTIVRHRVLVHACVRTQRVSHGQAIKDNNVRDVYNATIAVTSVAKLFQPAWLRLIRAISRDSFYHCFPAWRNDDRYRRLISHDWCPRKLRRSRMVIKIAIPPRTTSLRG